MTALGKLRPTTASGRQPLFKNTAAEQPDALVFASTHQHRATHTQLPRVRGQSRFHSQLPFPAILRRRFVAAGGRFAFGLFLQAQGGNLVGIGAELGFGLVLDVEDDVVEGPLGGDAGVAGGGEGVLGVDFGFAGGVNVVVLFGDGAQRVVGIGGLVVGDDFQGQEGIDVRLQNQRRDAGFSIFRHVLSSKRRGVEVGVPRRKYYIELSHPFKMHGAFFGAVTTRRRWAFAQAARFAMLTVPSVNLRGQL